LFEEQKDRRGGKKDERRRRLADCEREREKPKKI